MILSFGFLFVDFYLILPSSGFEAMVMFVSWNEPETSYIFLWFLLWKFGNSSTTMCNYPTCGYKPKTLCLIKEILFYVQCFSIHNSQEIETAKCPSTDEWIIKHGTYTELGVIQLLIKVKLWNSKVKWIWKFPKLRHMHIICFLLYVDVSF